MIRAVLDTNVLLAALRSRNGASFEILSRYRRGEFELLIGNTVLSEYDEVLKRECPGFGTSETIVDRFLNAICAAATPFRTSGFWKPSLPDPDDEAFAQLALEAKAGYLVTHNQRHFPADRLPTACRPLADRLPTACRPLADRLPTVKVVTPKFFLHILQSIVP